MLVNSFQHANTKNKLLSVTTGKLFESYGYQWEEGTCFYLRFVYAYSTLSSNLGMEYIWVVVDRIIK